MERDEVVARIESAVPEVDQVKVEGADCDFSALVLSESFAGVSQVKRQQQVLAAFADLLATGDLHALSVKAYTPEEWQKKQSASLTQLAL